MMLPDKLQDFWRRNDLLGWVGSTRMPASVRRRRHQYKRHAAVKRTGLLRTTSVGPSSGLAYAGTALQHAGPPSSMRTTAIRMQYPMQAASSILQQNHWLDPRCSCWCGGTVPFDLCLRTSLAHQIQRLALHCTCVCSAWQEEACLNPAMLARSHTKNWKKAVTAVDCELLCELSFASSTYVYL